MGRLFLLISLLLSFSACVGQKAEPKLYYFLTADSAFVGVKDEFGKIIIPAEFPYYGWLGDDMLIKEPTIEFLSAKSDLRQKKIDDLSPVTPVGAVYNRKGKFLYQAQLFDNGSDYWEEGLRRYAEDGKIGFVDRFGNKTLDAKWDFAYGFHYGYVPVFVGKLKKVYDTSGEHWTLGSDGIIESFLVNTKGERMYGYDKPKHPKDFLYDGKYYPYPFVYSEGEKEILKQLDKDIVGISFLLARNYVGFEGTPLQLEIIEHPNAFSNFYIAKAYKDQQAVSLFGDDIYIDASSGHAYVRNYDEGYVSLKDEIVSCLEELITFKEEVSPKYLQIAKQELERIKSHP